jgi:nucleoid-associated protein YejK
MVSQEIGQGENEQDPIKGPIEVTKFIVHEVDHHNQEKSRHSDIESPLDDRVKTFLENHILAARDKNHTKSAIFVKQEDEHTSIQKLSSDLLSDLSKFISLSQAIADRLFKAVKPLGRNASSGSLVVCVYTDEDASEEEANLPHLALLKMDAQDGFSSIRKRLDDGKVQTILEHISGVLPLIDDDLETGLQKAALIQPEKLRSAKRHLRVLDEQAGRGRSKRPVATFFQKDFLGCKVDVSPEKMTNIWVDSTEDWLEKKKDSWTPENIERYEQQVQATLATEEIDVESFAQSVITDEKEQLDFLQYVERRGLEDKIFKPDPKEVKRLTGFLTIRGDDDLYLRIDRDAVGEGKTLEFKEDPVSGVWTITIRTKKFEEN